MNTIAEPTTSELRSLVERSPESYALTRTVSELRRRPGVHKAFLNNEGPQTPDGEALAIWLTSYRIQNWLAGVSYRRRNDAIRGLLEKAAAVLADDQAALRMAWALWQESTAWLGLTQSARDLATLLFALAADHGPRVPLSHRPAMLGIEMMTGRKYTSLSTITDAREALVKAGVLTAVVGQAWQSGRVSRPTVFDLLPAPVRDQLKTLSTTQPNYALLQVHGHSSVTGDDAGEQYPIMTRAQRDTLFAYFLELRLRKDGQAEPEAVPAPTFSDLLDDLIEAESHQGEEAEVS